MTLTHPPFFIAPLTVARLLTSPLLPLLLLFLAPGRCFRTWVLTIYQFFNPFLSLRSIAQTSIPLPSIFRKLAGMALPPTLTLTVPLQRNTRLFLFPLLYVQVFPLKLAPFCMLFAGLGNTNKSAISLLFVSDLTLILSSLPFPLVHFSSYLKLCARSGRNCLLSPPVLSGYNGSLDTCFSRGTARLMCWPHVERYLHPPKFLVVSLLLSLVSTLVFSRTGGVLSHRSSLTHRFPRFPPRNLCSLVMLVVFSLFFAAMDTNFI